MITDERFTTVPLRVQNNKIQKAYIEEWTKERTVAEIVETVLGKGIPAGPINNVQQITEDDHIRNAREMFVDVKHPVIGDMTVNGNPIKLMDMMPRVNCPAPTLGQHNKDIYQGMLGLSDEEFAALSEGGII